MAVTAFAERCLRMPRRGSRPAMGRDGSDGGGSERGVGVVAWWETRNGNAPPKKAQLELKRKFPTKIRKNFGWGFRRCLGMGPGSRLRLSPTLMEAQKICA